MKQKPHAPPTGSDRDPDTSAGQTPDCNSMAPLPGEPGIPDIATPTRSPMSRKSLFALTLLVGSLVAVLAFSIHRVAASVRKPDGPDTALTRDRPAAASTEPRKLEIDAGSPPSSQPASAPRIPAITPTADELAEPIGVRRTGAATTTGSPPSASTKQALPEDAPVLLVTTRPNLQTASAGAGATYNGTAAQAPSSDTASPDPAARTSAMTATSRNLEDYQRRLQGLMDTLTQSTALASLQARNRQALPTGADERPPMTSMPGISMSAGGSPSSSGSGLFGGQLQGSSTPKATASMLGDLSLTLPKGAAATCALTTKVISATSGLVGCILQRDLYGANGRVVLLERGSHLDGEYRIATVKPGTVRIPVLWTRIRTPLGVTVDLESPGTGPLGESGIDGYVDNRWTARIGAAMLLSLIDDSVKLIIQNQANERQGDTIVMPSTTANTSKLAEKVLDSTINIPPLVYQNQGGIVGIYVARDLDFSSVYALRPTPGATQPEASR